MSERETQRQRLERCTAEVEKDPDRASAWFNLGRAYTRSGRIKEAEDAYLTALDRDPTLVQAWVNLGGVRLLRWDFEGCRDANRRAIEVAPECLEAHFNLGQALLYLKDAEGLLHANERVLQLDRDHGAAHYFAAVAHRELGNVSAAERHLARAMELGHQPEREFVKAMEEARLRQSRGEPLTFEIGGDSTPENTKEDGDAEV